MSSDKETKLNVIIVLDIIGRPAEHIVKHLERLILQIDDEKGINVKSKNIKEPTILEARKDFFTTFAEIEIELESLDKLILVLFKYMPAHIEIIEPEIVAISNNTWNEILNELARKLHGYDEVARVLQIENRKLLQKVQELGGKEAIKEIFGEREIMQQVPEKNQQSLKEKNSLDKKKKSKKTENSKKSKSKRSAK